jgi:hypothetical protein
VGFVLLIFLGFLFALSYYMSFRIAMSITISALNRCSVRHYLQFFVGGIVFYLRYLCFFANTGVQNIVLHFFSLSCVPFIASFPRLPLWYSLTFISKYWIQCFIFLYSCFCTFVISSGFTPKPVESLASWTALYLFYLGMDDRVPNVIGFCTFA